MSCGMSRRRRNQFILIRTVMHDRHTRSFGDDGDTNERDRREACGVKGNEGNRVILAAMLSRISHSLRRIK